MKTVLLKTTLNKTNKQKKNFVRFRLLEIKNNCLSSLISENNLPDIVRGIRSLDNPIVFLEIKELNQQISFSPCLQELNSAEKGRFRTYLKKNKIKRW